MASEQPAAEQPPAEQPAAEQAAAEQPLTEQAAEATPEKVASVAAGLTTLRPEDVTSAGLPVTMRGYDRDRVDRLLARVAEAYALTLQQCQTLRDGQRSLKAELDAAEGDASASARSVAELMRRSAMVEDQLVQMREARADLEARLELVESERKQALADLHEAGERTSDLSRRLDAFEGGQLPPGHVDATTLQPAAADGEAAQLLVAAARAAEDVRAASRARALRTLTKARDLAALVQAQTEREQAALVATQERRDEVEREANRVLARAQAEADSFVMAIEDERRRVRELLTGALVSLDGESAPPPESLMTDLESRLHETTEPTAT